MKCVRALVILSLASSACGGDLDPGRPADPLPAEFPFDYIELLVAGPATLESTEPLRYSTAFAPAAESESGGLYPIQYGIGYFYPTSGDARVEIGACVEEDSGFVTASCEASLLELELTVTRRPDYPDEFMDESTFSLEAAAHGTALRMFDESYELELGEVVILAETRTGASRSSYAGAIGAKLADNLQLDAQLRK
jgi:hypothetical protein